MAKTPTQRTVEHYAVQGYTVGVVERRIARTVSKDLYGFIDILAIRGRDVLAVQSTSASNVAARVAKIRESENLPAVLAAGWRVLVVGWDHRPEPRIIDLTE